MAVAKQIKTKFSTIVELKIAFEKLRKEIAQLKQKVETPSLANSNVLQQLFLVESASQIQFLQLCEIVYLKADKNYTKFICNKKTKLVSTKTIKYHEAKLPTTLFFRIHHGYLINLHHLLVIKKNTELVAIMSNGDTIPISIRKKKEILTLIQQSNWVADATVIS